MGLLWHLRSWRGFTAGFILLFLPWCCPAAEPKRVLVLDSFGRDVAPFSAVASSFRTALARELGEPVDIYEVSLDMARFGDRGSEVPFAEFLEKRFASRPVDLVVPVGASATKFAVQYRERLFAETHLLFAGVDTRVLPPNQLPPNAALVTQQVDLHGFIRDMLELQPGTTNILVVFGASPLEVFWARECRREWQVYTNRITFSWLDGLPLRQIQKAAHVAPPRSFIFFGLMVLDGDRVPYDGNGPLRSIHAVANAPIFGCFKDQFGQGTIGGRLFQSRGIGERAAQVAIRILRGEAPENIPPELLSPSPPTYDWRELKRWGIGASQLPAGSVIEFRTPTFWTEYKWRIAIVIVVFCVQSGLIIGLVILRAKRRSSQAAASLIADLSSKFVNLPPHEVDREIEDAQRKVCEGLGLELSALWQWSGESPELITMSHLYRPLGGPPIPEPMDGAKHFPWCVRNLQEGKVLVVSSMAELPPEAVRDRESWTYFGIKSNLTFPLSTGGGRHLGALSFNTMTSERTWPKPLVTRLQLVAQIFANALARKRADQALRESELRLSLAADSAGAGLWSLNLSTGQYWLTKKAREIFNLPPDSTVSYEQFLSIVHPEDRPGIRKLVQEMLQSKREAVVEYRVAEGDGKVRWMASRGRVQSDAEGKAEHLTGVTVDVTQRKLAEKALREFSRQLINTQEQERSRLARELHDDITQRLARLAIDVGRCEAGMSDESPAETTKRVRLELVRVSEDVHALSYRLHPSILEDLGLSAALKAEAERFEREEATRVEVKVQELPEPLPADLALCVFRVAQEGLRNAARHARARAIKLSLRSADGGLQLAVQDDGCGFDPAAQRERPSLGLASMRERVNLVAGELEIESAPGQGTTVLAWVPLEAKRK